jgi:hypothetical protein
MITSQKINIFEKKYFYKANFTFTTNSKTPMKYKVIPFVPSVANKSTSELAAKQLEAIINEMSQEGWNYVRVENITTLIAGTNGCFGLFGSPPQISTKQLIVFAQE